MYKTPLITPRVKVVGGGGGVIVGVMVSQFGPRPVQMAMCNAVRFPLDQKISYGKFRVGATCCSHFVLRCLVWGQRHLSRFRFIANGGSAAMSAARTADVTDLRALGALGITSPPPSLLGQLRGGCKVGGYRRTSAIHAREN